MAILCQALKKEGQTTIGSSPSTFVIDTQMEVRSNFNKRSLLQIVVTNATSYNRQKTGET